MKMFREEKRSPKSFILACEQKCFIEPHRTNLCDSWNTVSGGTASVGLGRNFLVFKKQNKQKNSKPSLSRGDSLRCLFVCVCVCGVSVNNALYSRPIFF